MLDGFVGIERFSVDTTIYCHWTKHTQRIKLINRKKTWIAQDHMMHFGNIINATTYHFTFQHLKYHLGRLSRIHERMHIPDEDEKIIEIAFYCNWFKISDELTIIVFVSYLQISFGEKFAVLAVQFTCNKLFVICLQKLCMFYNIFFCCIWKSVPVTVVLNKLCSTILHMGKDVDGIKLASWHCIVHLCATQHKSK